MTNHESPEPTSFHDTDTPNERVEPSVNPSNTNKDPYIIIPGPDGRTERIKNLVTGEVQVVYLEK